MKETSPCRLVHCRFERRAGRGIAAWKVLLVLVLLLTAGGGAVAWKVRSKARAGLEGSTRAKVRRGDLVITVLQSGELESKRSESITNETDREAKILYVVEDGARVQKGDLLVELESEELRNRLLQAQSSMSRAESELKNAEEELEIRRLKYQTDLDNANLRIELAKLEIKKYVEAEYPQRVDKATLDITIAKQELSRSRDRLEWTERLVANDYASRQDLESTQLEVQRKEIEVRNKEADLKILREYTHIKELKEKENEVAKAEAELDRLVKTYDSERARGLANLESRKTSLEVERRQLRKIEEQVEKTRVVSEWNGQVFYPKMRQWDTRKIEKGASVYPRQQMLQFPDLSSWRITVGVPESIIDRIRPGQKGVATIDAMPGEILEAVVQRVSVVPDQSRWYDSSTKTYTVMLDVPTTPTVELKPGMSTSVEIVTAILRDVVYIPIQAVLTENEQHYVFLVDGNTVKKAGVETAENNEEYIRVADGLTEGQEVLLYAPVEAELRAGLKERPLDRAKRSGKEVDIEPGAAALPPNGNGQSASPNGQPTANGKAAANGRPAPTASGAGARRARTQPQGAAAP